MNCAAALPIAAATFVGSHLLMSHPLRRPLVARLGEKAFGGVYSVVALITFGLMLYCYWRIGDQAPFWRLGEWAWTAASVLVWFAAILLVGSLRGNPALPGARRPKAGPTGVFAITRHPMMWSFAIWAAVHWALIATPKAAILDGAIIFLALVGALGQERKKAQKLGASWHEWQARTAFVPFTRGAGHPGALALVGGTILYLAASWLHPFPVGIWRIVG